MNAESKTLKNLKFRIANAEQSERLQNVLCSLGYKWFNGSDVQYTDREFLYTSANGLISFGTYRDTFDTHNSEEQDAEAFIAEHTAPFKGLEHAFDAPSGESPVVLEPHSAPWIDNDGTMPDLEAGTLVDIELRNGVLLDRGGRFEHYAWQFEHNGADIIKWRFHRPEDSLYYRQPKTYINGPSEGHFEWIRANVQEDILAKEVPVRNKYMREIKPGVWCDVYDLLRAFNVTDPCLQHLVKKALAVGQRGHKDATTDYKDILASAVRALELHTEWEGV